MASSRKAPPNFWSMGGAATIVKRRSSKIDVLLTEAQSRLKAGDLQKALALAQQAVQTADNASSRLALATVLLVTGDIKGAESNYMSALRHEPRHFKALLGLGQLKLNSYKAQAALQLLKAAVAVDPRNIDAQHLLARAYGANGQMDEALKLFTKLISEAPRDADIRAGYARALLLSGAAEESIKAYKSAAELKPPDDAIEQGLAMAHQRVGRLEEAELHARNAIRLKPERGTPYTQLGKMKRLDSSEVAPLEKQLAQLPQGDPRRISCLSAIAMATEAAGDYARCFAAISEALSIKASLRRAIYDPDSLSAFTDKVINALGAATTAPSATKWMRAIFITGMPRSGSTLTEQVLAQHPEVYAAGEWPAMNKVEQAAEKFADPYPKGMPALTADGIEKLRAIYFSDLPPDEKSKTAVTDKMLKNVFYLPLIEAMFADARIVRCHRHPMDILWSMMNEWFGPALPFGSKIEDICHYMLQQDRIWQAWSVRGTLPTLDHFYEEFVEHFEPSARKLVQFAELEWNEACLRPHESRRTVLTASAGQVHRPVSKASVGRWRPFAPYLSQALEVLKPLIEAHETQLAKRGIAYP
jgi:tetratricopeptide (TPR) repeat protein